MLTINRTTLEGFDSDVPRATLVCRRHDVTHNILYERVALPAHGAPYSHCALSTPVSVKKTVKNQTAAPGRRYCLRFYVGGPPRLPWFVSGHQKQGYSDTWCIRDGWHKTKVGVSHTQVKAAKKQFRVMHDFPITTSNETISENMSSSALLSGLLRPHASSQTIDMKVTHFMGSIYLPFYRTLI